MDNYWVHNSTTKTQNGQEVSMYWCRRWKESQQKSSSQGLRNKRIRITASPCGMKIKLCKTFDTPNDSHPGGRLMKVEISKHLTKRGGAVPCTEHNHTAEYLDTIKVNSGVKIAAAVEVSHGYAPATVNRTLQGVKWKKNKEVLHNAGGAYLNLKGYIMPELLGKKKILIHE